MTVETWPRGSHLIQDQNRSVGSSVPLSSLPWLSLPSKTWCGVGTQLCKSPISLCLHRTERYVAASATGHSLSSAVGCVPGSNPTTLRGHGTDGRGAPFTDHRKFHAQGSKWGATPSKTRRVNPMTKHRGNPNWGKPDQSGPVVHLPSSFEQKIGRAHV